MSISSSESLKPENLKHEILTDEHTYYDYTFKLIVIGDSFVGKSCLTNRATRNTFDESYSATVGFEFVTSNIKINEKVCKLQIWDTCGQEVYRSLITSFYRNSSLAILVYSIDNQESFNNLELWLKELKTFSSPDAKVFLVGNKCDLESKRVVPKEKGEEFKNENGLDFFIETSAKSGFNAEKIFVEAAKILYIDWLKYSSKKESMSYSESINSSLKNNRTKINIYESSTDSNKCKC